MFDPQCTAQKMSKYEVFSGPYFPGFIPNMGKYGPEKTPYLNTFYAVVFSPNKSEVRIWSYGWFCINLLLQSASEAYKEPCKPSMTETVFYKTNSRVSAIFQLILGTFSFVHLLHVLQLHKLYSSAATVEYLKLVHFHKIYCWRIRAYPEPCKICHVECYTKLFLKKALY